MLKILFYTYKNELLCVCFAKTGKCLDRLFFSVLFAYTGVDLDHKK